MPNTHIRKAVEAAERAETPYILFLEDLALRLRLEVDQVRTAILGGCLGPWLTINGRPAVTRDSLKQHLKACTGRHFIGDRELLSSGHRKAGRCRRAGA